MALITEFLPLNANEIVDVARTMKDKGYRYVQTLCVNCDGGVEVQYTYNLNNEYKIYTTDPIPEEVTIQSISDVYLEAFVFENEAHDLFGVKIEGMAIDFKGGFYHVAKSNPMTIISPEQKAAKEKAAASAAAKAARAARSASAAKAVQEGGDGIGATADKAGTVDAAADRAAAREARRAARAAKATGVQSNNDEGAGAVETVAKIAAPEAGAEDAVADRAAAREARRAAREAKRQAAAAQENTESGE